MTSATAFTPAILGELEELLGEQFAALLNTFLEDSTRLVGRIHGAIDASARGDIRLHAHSLKGAAGNLGAEAMRERCFQIERAADTAEFAELARLHGELVSAHGVAVRELQQRLDELSRG